MKKKTKIEYRLCVAHLFNGEWEWEAHIWFNNSFFANVSISSAGYQVFKSQEECLKDAHKYLKLLGLTKRNQMKKIKV